MLFRYLLVGGGAYLVEMATLFLLKKVSLGNVESVAVSFWVGLIVAFVLQKSITFRSRAKSKKHLTHQATLYLLLVAINYLFTLAVVALIGNVITVFGARTFAIVITTAWNYAIYKIIFHDNPRLYIKEMAQKYSLRSRIRNNRRPIIIGLCMTLPLLLFFWQYLMTGSRLIPGDFDYYSQVYEAFRISVVHFHQLPLWNPWMSGGVPLFANPQFGLFSLQSLLVLPFGVIYGLKLAYVVYAVVGFWGMYTLMRTIVKASPLRSALIAYIWIFCGFFAGHNISHITTASFFLLPWIIYFLMNRHKRYSWLWFGIITSIVVLGAIDFVLLMIFFIAAVLCVFYAIPIVANRLELEIKWRVTRDDLLFVVKAGLLVLILCGYRFAMAYIYVANNPRPVALLHETRPGISVLLKGLFLPIGTLLKTPAHLQWGWGEYSMYMGMGVSVAFFVCLLLLLIKLFQKRGRGTYVLSSFVWSMIAIGIIGFLIAIGDFGKFSPYHILRSLPGFSKTRVSSRWLFLSNFAILTFLAAWKYNKKLIDVLLVLSVIELFFTFGPPRINGSDEVRLPTSHFSSVFTEYDNGRQHSGVSMHAMHSYYYATSMNKGQVYSDEPFADTLDKVVGTDRCGLNADAACTFVLTRNAKVTYWSPDKISLKRTAPGSIALNMNVSGGWKVNGVYPFASIKSIDPSLEFVLPGNAQSYSLEYAPRFSPAWISWRVGRL